MSSSNDSITITTLTGPNYLSWAPKMHAYHQAKCFWFTIRNERPAPAAKDEDTKAIKHWDDGNDQATGHLILRMDNHIANKYSTMETAKEIWDDLEAQYFKPSIASIYMEFKVLINTNIPDGNHPAPAFTKLMAHFQCLKEFKFEVSKEIQALLVLAKLPSYMNVITHLINLAADKDASTTSSFTSSTPPASPIPDLTAIKHMATFAWQQHVNKCPPKGKAANKLSMVKCKGKDPKFQQQQQQLQQQESGGDKDKKRRANAVSTLKQGKQNRTSAIRPSPTLLPSTPLPSSISWMHPSLTPPSPPSPNPPLTLTTSLIPPAQLILGCQPSLKHSAASRSHIALGKSPLSRWSTAWTQLLIGKGMGNLQVALLQLVPLPMTYLCWKLT